MEPPTYETIGLNVHHTHLRLSTLFRPGSEPAIFFLHGFGSCKEDLHDITLLPQFKNHTFLAYDAPGCGQSESTNPSKTTITFLVSTAKAVLDHYGISKFHLIGHSMGGLTALMFASSHRDHVLSFINIKGNLAPEDCFLSRQIFSHPGTTQEEFFDDFIKRTRESPSFSNALYAAGLKYKVHVDAVEPIFKSMVQLSDFEDLLGRFLSLGCPLMFMYGEQNRNLSYLTRLADSGVELAEIPLSGHFPMYANPAEMYRRITTFLKK
ncbi:alpha/beta-hydrolase [Aspergillus ambiguus]|uniref:alpha/beta fold hydrolase n=1 Tax=Aspergillus ambiguus TaxID=176160 RepID=UPI003CCCB077